MELALACVVQAEINNGDVRFKVFESTGPAKVCTEDQILAEVLPNMGFKFRKVVRHCFEYDRKDNPNSDHSAAVRDGYLKAGDVLKYKKDILEPLREIYTLIANHRSSFTGATSILEDSRDHFQKTIIS